MWHPGPRTFATLGVVLILFALPLFRAPPAADATSSAEEQAAQSEQDKSSRAAAVAERSIARAAMLGEIGAAWAKIDRSRGEQILDEALEAEAAAREEADALWGRAQAAEEAAVTSAATRNKAGLVAEELLAVRNRAWGLRAIAEQWATVDPQRAKEVLTRAEAVARSNMTIYGALDLRAVAAAWATLDPAHTVDLPSQEAQAAITSTDAAEAEALARYAAGDYQKAWDAAVGIADEWDRARAQSSIAAAWKNSAAVSEIAVPSLRDRSLRTIVASTGEASLVDRITSPYQRVMALAEIGRSADAAARAGSLSEKSPLVNVVAALVPSQPADALALVDRLSRESDKAEALVSVALATGDPAIFDRALSMVAAARVRGDALAPARASLALARALMEEPGGKANALAALEQAYNLAAKVSVKYK
jgi:hypothetical protein